MSLICLCVVENIKNDSEMTIQLEALAKHYKRGIKFFVDWDEPIVANVQNNSLIINIVDSPESDNCEFLLLPDGWYFNGLTNKLAFRERMNFLQEISNIFINRRLNVEFYLAGSGTLLEDYLHVTLNNNNFTGYLTNSIGIKGVEFFGGLHISVIP